MALQDLINLNEERKKIGISEERLRAIMPVARKYIAFWREYPDLFIDFMAHGRHGDNGEDNNTFHFFFY